ncbi:MAG: VWA domain-containing protein [Planctomycetes bacterium]|nr:VWA domain-containing protein [Planctomycetota bacterium]
MNRLLAVSSSWLLLSSLALPAQVLGDPDAERRENLRVRSAAVADGLRAWAADFDADRLGPAGLLRDAGGLNPAYVASAKVADLVRKADYDRINHLDMLQKMLFFAESNADENLADAALAVAGAGLEKSLVDRTALQVRDLGHWTLMRMENQGAWFAIMRAAAGERLPLAGGGDDEPGPAGVSRQVAALKALGMKGKPVFRSTIEGALAHADPRVRLAAVEALEFQRRPESMRTLTRVMNAERHPIVSQALVRAVQAILKAHGARLPASDRVWAVQITLKMVGQCGWRTDMELVALVEEFPCKEAIPELISVLERAALPPDKLVETVNKNASPLLRERAWNALRGLTGALIAADEPKAWREFWEREQHKIVVPDRVGRKREEGNTRAAFFGVPVTGRTIGFVIDTSGSMNAQAAGTIGNGGQGAADERIPTRLRAAKDQLLTAISAMAPGSRYHVFTFASEARAWSTRPVPVAAESTRQLTELLSRFKADGGTNMFEGLALALAAGELRYGEADQDGIDELFLLSDGEPTAGEIREPDEIRKLLLEANKYRKVRINTVFTGNGAGADFLRKLAEDHDGVFVQR